MIASEVIEHVNRPDMFFKTLAGLIRRPSDSLGRGSSGSGKASGGPRGVSSGSASSSDEGDAGSRSNTATDDKGAEERPGGRACHRGGLLILSTMNRTAEAYAIAIVGAEYITGIVPRGTHEWSRFITPQELTLLAIQVTHHTHRGLSPDDS